MRKSIFYALILTGVTAISSQIILIREFFTTFYGNELSIGFILTIWLAGGSIGSGVLGVIFADRIRKKLSVFSLIQIILSILIPCGIIFARMLKLFFAIRAGEIVSLPVFLVTSTFALLPIAISLGFLFVLGCKMLPQNTDSVGIGRVYTLEAIGAMLGGTITSLVLIRYLGALQIACLISSLNLISAAFLARQNASRLRSITAIILLCVLALFTISGGLNTLDKRSLELKWTPFKMLESKDSIYGRTSVTQKDGQLNFFNNALLAFSSHDLLTAEEAVHLPFTFCDNPKKVLLIGSGAGETMNEILKYPVETVDYVELNPLIISFSKKFLRDEPFYRLDDPRVNVKNLDGRYFIKNTANLYDVVIINLPNPYTAAINRFYTQEFFKELKRILSPGAVVSFGVTSSENYLSRELSLFLKTLLTTARAEFAEVQVVPGDTAYFLLSQEAGSIALDYNKIVNRLKSRGIKTFYVRGYYLSSKLSEERINFLRSAMRRTGRVRKNKDFHPISYFYDMVLWSTYLNFKLAKFLMFFTRGRLLVFTLGAFFILFAVFFFRRRNKHFKEETVLLALCTTGLSEIAFEILIVIAFQIIYGFLYYKIGIIVTSFMFGLGLGSLYITQRLSKISRPFNAYIAIQALVLIYPLALLLFFKTFSSLSAYPVFNRIGGNLFAVLPFIAGFIGGMQYPLANKICLGRGGQVGKTAGTTYAVDLFGSFVGALLLCSFFVPIVGIPLTCVLVAALNAVSLALLLLSRART